MTKAELAKGVRLMNAGHASERIEPAMRFPDADGAAVRAAAALRLGHPAHPAVGLRRPHRAGRGRGSWSLSHKPSQSQRASDLAGYFGDVTAGIGSCAGGAARLRERPTSRCSAATRPTSRPPSASSRYGANNCTLANNESLTDFASYQVTESLAQFPLDTADNDVITWSFDATDVQQDMLAVLRAQHARRPGRGEGDAEQALATLDAQRAAIDAIWHNAEQTVGSTAALPYLPT